MNRYAYFFEVLKELYKKDLVVLWCMERRRQDGSDM